ncbi:MAG: SAM-dependent methyltransferase [Polyangia bacterium]
MRTVHHGDAIAWLAENALDGASVITSLPDLSEVPHMGRDGWLKWFEDSAHLVLEKTPPSSVALFYQSDIRHDGTWIDKGHLVQRAADRAGVALLAHKIVNRKIAGTVTHGRASYTHLLAFSRRIRPSLRTVTADVLDAGTMPTPKSMGVNACVEACRFVLEHTTTRTIVDPFCGAGTVLAVANAMGMDAVGVDLSTRQVRKARALQIML